jgi:hypothetical protein
MEIALAYDVCDHRFLLFAKGVHGAGALETGALGVAVPGSVDLLPILVAAALVRVVPVMDACARGVPVRNFPVTSVPERDAVEHPCYSADLAELRLEVEFHANV